MSSHATPVARPDAASTSAPRKLDVDLLYLDLTTCGRCVGSGRNLEAAIADVSSLLGQAGVEVSLQKVHVSTAELARKHRLVSSPTIRVNGRDVALELRESSCEDCAEICGCGGGVDCRVWVWDGREHADAPKAMLVDALLRAVYAPAPLVQERTYELPENLRKFYEATAASQGEAACCADPSACCADEKEAAASQHASTSCCAKPETCCAPAGGGER